MVDAHGHVYASIYHIRSTCLVGFSAYIEKVYDVATYTNIYCILRNISIPHREE
ncbi:hypothetical protein MYVALT_F_02510 [Candidatus Vallotia tarda]|uniref:Uncharacterized protein n=1 Tax=Candidatus Vallotiella hemipterorum TaxID=1177213 RepID=A0A916JTB8_9BURK|nr:hypothetical protein MYVALT_F_02510 [Candidatus Vallotia tarda]